MDVMPLLRKIDLALAVANMTDRAACLAAKKFCVDVNVDFIRDLRRRHHDPKTGKLLALALAIGTDLSSLLIDYPGALPAKVTERDYVGRFDVVARRAGVGSALNELTLSLGGPEQGEFVKEPGELALLRFWRSLGEGDKHEVVRRLSYQV